MLPLDDRRVERFNPDLAGRPQLIKGNSQILFGGMGRLTENSVLNIKNKSHAVTAQIDVPDGGAEGVIIAQGGAFGGWSLYAQGGQAAVLLQLLRPRSASRSRRRTPLPAGEHQVRMEFAYDGGGLGKGGDGRRSTSTAARSARAGSSATQPMVFSADETTDVGCDTGDAGQRRLRPRDDSALHRHGSAGSRSTSARTPRTPTT